MSEDQHQTPAAPNKKAKRAALQRSLPTLLADAQYGGEAVSAALRACSALRLTPPAELLTSENIARLKIDDAIKLLPRLGQNTVETDVSAALTGIQQLLLASRAATSNSRSLNSLSRRVAQKLLEVAGKRRVRRSVRRPDFGKGEVRFTSGTVKSAVSLAAWLTKAAVRLQQQDSRVKKSGNLYSALLLWSQTLQALAPAESNLESVVEVLGFWRTLRSVLPLSMYLRLDKEPSRVSSLETAQSTILGSIEPALRHGRLDKLEILRSIAETDADLRAQILSRMREAGTRLSLELPPGVAEWLRSALHEEIQFRPELRAADESQSSLYELFSICLLSAWDTARDPKHAEETFRTVRQFARDAFKLDLVEQTGDVVSFDGRRHQLFGNIEQSGMVRVVRPGVAWSNGLRSRVIVRALVEQIPTGEKPQQ